MCLSRWHWVFQKTAEAKRIKERTPLTLILTLTLTPTLALTPTLTLTPIPTLTGVVLYGVLLVVP